MAIGPEITADDVAAIGQLVAIECHEIRHFAEETRLKFNSLAAVRVFVLGVWAKGKEGEIEVVHWVGDDEWELVHSTFP